MVDSRMVDSRMVNSTGYSSLTTHAVSCPLCATALFVRYYLAQLYTCARIEAALSGYRRDEAL